MKLKSLLLTTILSLFFVSGLLAQNSERIYIRSITQSPGIGKTKLLIYEKGNVKEMELPNTFKNDAESLAGFADVLEKYFSLGYKVISNTTHSSTQNVANVTEYILEKQ